MSIQIQCECGKSLRVKDELAGKKVRCPGCKEILVAPRPGGENADEDDAPVMLVTATPPSLKRTVPPKPKYDGEEDEEDRPRSKSRRRRDEDDEDDEDERPSRSRKRRNDDDDDRPRSIAKRRRTLPNQSASNGIPASVGAGVAMMIGAVIWFVGGLFFDIIFFYPPILFIIGIAAVVRGALSR